MKRNIETVDLYGRIHYGISSVARRADSLIMENETLTKYLFVYEHLTFMVTRDSLTSELRRIGEEIDEKLSSVLEDAGISPEEYRKSEESALDELERNLFRRQGSGNFIQGIQGLSKFLAQQEQRLIHLSSLQNRLAEIAFEAEGFWFDVDDPCLGVFLRRRQEKEAQRNPSADEFSLNWCKCCGKPCDEKK